MTLHYCDTCSFFLLVLFPWAIFLLITQLSIQQLTSTLTQWLILLQQDTRFLALTAPYFVVWQRRALWDHPEQKQTNSASAESQLSPNTQQAPQTVTQNLITRFFKLEKMFTDRIATYTSNTSRIDCQYFFLYETNRQLELGQSNTRLWRILSVNFVFNSAKVSRPSSDLLIESATSFNSRIIRTHPNGHKFLIKSYPYGIGSATGKSASILFTSFFGDYYNMFRWPFQKPIHLDVRHELDPLNAWTQTIQSEQDPAYEQHTNSKKAGVSAIVVNIFIPRPKLFSKTERFLIDCAMFLQIKTSDTLLLKFLIRTAFHFPFP